MRTCSQMKQVKKGLHLSEALLIQQNETYLILIYIKFNWLKGETDQIYALLNVKCHIYKIDLVLL